MYNPINSILHSAKKQNDKLNILTFVSHERFEPNLCLTGHNFYSLITEGTRQWKEQYSPIPSNYHIFRDKVPEYFLNEIDLIISHNPFVHIPLAHNLHLDIPVINIFHTMPSPGWDNINIHPQAKDMFDWCTEHIYISEFNKAAWGYDRGKVIHHGLDTELFCPPTNNEKRKNKVLTIANDYINRDWALGFRIWDHIKNKLGREIMWPVGDTPGLSGPAKDMDELLWCYQSSSIFLNTSTASPIPMSLLEAMSCECAIVSSATCMIPEIIEHGVDGFLCPPNKPDKFVEYINILLKDYEMAREMGKNARIKIQSMFDLDRFVNGWNQTFLDVLNGR